MENHKLRQISSWLKSIMTVLLVVMGLMFAEPGLLVHGMEAASPNTATLTSIPADGESTAEAVDDSVPLNDELNDEGVTEANSPPAETLATETNLDQGSAQDVSDSSLSSVDNPTSEARLLDDSSQETSNAKQLANPLPQSLTDSAAPNTVDGSEATAASEKTVEAANSQDKATLKFPEITFYGTKEVRDGYYSEEIINIVASDDFMASSAYSEALTENTSSEITADTQELESQGLFEEDFQEVVKRILENTTFTFES